MKINVASVQAFVGTVLAGIVEALDAAENNCMPLAALTEALREQGLDVTEEQVAGIVAITPELETAKRRGIGFAGERASKPAREPGARVQKWVQNTRQEMLHGMILAGVTRDQLIASNMATEREVDIAFTNLAEARSAEDRKREAIEAFVAAHRAAKTG